MNPLREKILAADDIVWEKVFVSEWNAEIWIRSLTGAEKDEFEESVLVRKGKGRKAKREADTNKLRAKLVIKATVVADKSVEPLFKSTDVDALASKNGAALEKVFDVAHRLAGMSSEDIEEAGNE